VSVVGFDHAAVPSADPEALIRFYGALGFGVPDLETFRAEDPLYFHIQFGDNKLNVHTPKLWHKERFTLRGPTARPGCGDFCFVWSGTVASLRQALDAAGALVIEGPVPREGGRGAGHQTGTSIYSRDPDQNLLEFIVYEHDTLTEPNQAAAPTEYIDNPRTRVTEWRFAPGASTGWHRHELDYVIVPLSTGRLKLLDADGNETIAELQVGVPYFREAGVEHDVINDNAFEFAFMEVEIK